MQPLSPSLCPLSLSLSATPLTGLLRFLPFRRSKTNGAFPRRLRRGKKAVHLSNASFRPLHSFIVASFNLKSGGVEVLFQIIAISLTHFPVVLQSSDDDPLRDSKSA